mmetsp:Transcript_19111/g.27338  ORF Transcript_19111/g.27338 Transcript_19111/m.27338 type:complete len:549 (-) Transcript_19111:133-1779(-)
MFHSMTFKLLFYFSIIFTLLLISTSLNFESASCSLNIFHPAVFNWSWYISHHSDLKLLGINTEDKSREHWVKYGLSDSRQACEDFHITQYRKKFISSSSLTNAAVINQFLSTTELIKWNDYHMFGYIHCQFDKKTISNILRKLFWTKYTVMKDILLNFDIKILPISPTKFSSKCPYIVKYPGAANDIHQGHGQDMLYRRFFQDQNRSVLSLDTPQQAKDVLTYYFLPAYHFTCRIDEYKLSDRIQWWIDLDSELHGIILRAGEIEGPFVTLDRIFMVSTHPHHVPPPREIPMHFQYRNILDMRYFRSDNQESPNGRDVYIPYVVHAERFHLNNWNISLSPRPKFIFANCLAKSDEIVRNWRVKAYNLLSVHSLVVNTSIVVSKYTTEKEFDEALVLSDFCIIVPGDTTSTARLYKAIFSGCIPVIFVTNIQQLPFQNFVDWSTFSIIVLKDILNYPRKMDTLVKTLSLIRTDYSERLAKLKLNLLLIAKCFDWHSMSWPSPYHLSLLELFQSDACGGKTPMIEIPNSFQNTICNSRLRSKNRRDDRDP